MSGHNTKIVQSRFGDLKFPKNDDPPNSQVTSYTLSPEEIRQKYGAPVSDTLTYERFKELKSKGLNYRQIAEKTGLKEPIVKALASKYMHEERRGGESMPPKTIPNTVPAKDEKQPPLAKTKENYLMLRDQGLTIKEIADRMGTSDSSIFAYKKKWGLTQSDDQAELAKLKQEYEELKKLNQFLQDNLKVYEEHQYQEERILSPTEYMKLILNGDTISTRDEQMKEMINKAVEALGIACVIETKAEWKLSLRGA